jgi:lipopolysaccharide assembly protein A
MKGQWSLILAILFALIVAIFAVINVEPVTVDFLFAKKSIPLILVVIGSVFMGGVIVGSVGLYRLYRIQRQLKTSQKENAILTEKVEKLTPQEEEKLVSEKSDEDTTEEETVKE